LNADISTVEATSLSVRPRNGRLKTEVRFLDGRIFTIFHQKAGGHEENEPRQLAMQSRFYSSTYEMRT